MPNGGLLPVAGLAAVFLTDCDGCNVGKGAIYLSEKQEARKADCGCFG